MCAFVQYLFAVAWGTSFFMYDNNIDAMVYHVSVISIELE